MDVPVVNVPAASTKPPVAPADPDRAQDDRAAGSRSEFERRNHHTAELLKRSRDPGSAEAERQHCLQLAVSLNVPIADSLARRYRSRGEDLDDLVQVARTGLLKAATRFNPEQGEFLSFAVPTITGELKRHFRDHCWTIRPPRRVQELRSEVMSAWSELAQERSHTPTTAEVADWLGVDRAEVLEAMATNTFTPTSLDAPDSSQTPVQDHLGDSDPGFDEVDDALERAEMMDEVRAACRRLPDQDRRILQLRFGENRTQAAIATELGISQMSVSRRLSKIATQLRQELTTTPDSSPPSRTVRARRVKSQPRQPARA